MLWDQGLYLQTLLHILSMSAIASQSLLEKLNAAIWLQQCAIFIDGVGRTVMALVEMCEMACR